MWWTCSAANMFCASTRSIRGWRLTHQNDVMQVLFHGSTGTAATGVRDLRWTAASTAEGLLWQARRVFRDLDLVGDTEKTALHVIWDRESKKWSQVCTASGGDPALHFHRSAKSKRAHGDASSAMDEYHISTAGLLLLLVQYAYNRKAVADRTLASDCLREFLRVTCVVKCIWLEALEHAGSNQCWYNIDDEGRCGHVARMLDALKSKRLPRTSLCCFWDSLCVHAAESIDTGSEAWSASAIEVPKLVGPAGKRCRLDVQERKELFDGTGNGTGNARWWMSKQMLAVLCTSTEVLRRRVLSSAMDGGRLGKPPRDCLVHWIQHAESGHALLLPPMVKRNETSRPPNPLSQIYFRVMSTEVGLVCIEIVTRNSPDPSIPRHMHRKLAKAVQTSSKPSKGVKVHKTLEASACHLARQSHRKLAKVPRNSPKLANPRGNIYPDTPEVQN
eukprot:6480887-Amphidinium_carterae.2